MERAEQGERVGPGPAVLARGEEESVERQGAGAAPVVAPLRADADDRPRPARKPEGEQTRRISHARWALAEVLTRRAELGQPFGPATRRPRQQGVTLVAEREAAVNRLFEADDGHGQPSGFGSAGILKSEANVNEVRPPFDARIVPERLRIARGSPLRVVKT